MTSNFDDFSLLHGDDPVCASYCRKPVGDDKGCPPQHESIQRLPHKSFTFRVQSRGGLVKKQYSGIPDECPRDGHALALST